MGTDTGQGQDKPSAGGVLGEESGVSARSQIFAAVQQGQAHRDGEPAAVKPVPVVGEAELAFAVFLDLTYQTLAVPHPAALRRSHLSLP